DGQPGDVPYSVTVGQATSSDPNYNGLKPSDVSLTNLATEKRGLQVTNLASSPAAGLQSGSTLTLNWNDVNSGNVPAAAARADQAVIKNVTTGVTLTTATVHYDEPTYGPLAPGASLARQFTYALPDGANGAGDLQVTVTADVNHAIDGQTSLLNADLRT